MRSISNLGIYGGIEEELFHKKKNMHFQLIFKEVINTTKVFENCIIEQWCIISQWMTVSVYPSNDNLRYKAHFIFRQVAMYQGSRGDLKFARTMRRQVSFD